MARLVGRLYCGGWELEDRVVMPVSLLQKEGDKADGSRKGNEVKFHDQELDIYIKDEHLTVTVTRECRDGVIMCKVTMVM